MIKDLIYELSISKESETGALGIALACFRESKNKVSLTFLKPNFQLTVAR